MKARKLQPALVLSFMFIASLSFGQKLFHKANKQYDLKHYELAIETYNEYLKSDPTNLEAKTRLADSYRMSNALVEAADLYDGLVSIENIDPTVIKNYGLTLMKMGKYDQAKYYFKIYKVYDPQEGEHFDMACDYAKTTFEMPVTHEVELVNVNSPSSDFGVTFFGDQIVFSSFRNDLTEKAGSGQALNGNILYIADLDENMRADNVNFLRSAISEKKNIGPVSYNVAGGKVAFARNKIKNGGAHVTGDDSKHSLYIGELTADGDWQEEMSFRYNEFGTSTAFPCLAFDGSALYFSSNRVGGYGGYDIYVSYFKNNEWSYPQNLGAAINTKGDEITPFFDDQNLYFASNYMHGLGGYDIFSSEVRDGQWTFPTNLGNGVNSPGDDYYPAKKASSDMLFFSSNRLGGRGMDDIYLAVPTTPELELASMDTPPPAVSLASLVKETGNSTIGQIGAQEVSSTEVIRVTTVPVEDIETALLSDTPPPAVKLGDILPPATEIQNSDETITDVESEIPASEKVVATTVVETQPDPIVKDAPEEIKVLENEQTTEVVENSLDTKEAKSSYVETDETKIDATLEMDENGGFVETITVTTMVNDIPSEVTESTEVQEEINTSIEIENLEEEQIVETDIIEDNAPTTTVVAETAPEKPEVYAIPDFKSVSAKAAPLNLDISDAKRVALGEILPANQVYFIQLAALYRSKGNVDKYNSLKRYGNLYKVYKSNSTKIKLGYFLDKSEADNVLQQIKSRGYNDAFITKDFLNSSELELIVASEAQSNYDSYTSNQPVTTTVALSNKSYKVRLASYEDPIWFDIAGAKDLGQIEQWTKGGWTIFILSGYNNFNDAEAARIRAVNKGFADAEVVIDNNGILERLRMN